MSWETDMKVAENALVRAKAKHEEVTKAANDADKALARSRPEDSNRKAVEKTAKRCHNDWQKSATAVRVLADRVRELRKRKPKG